MKARDFQPRKLHIGAFIETGATLEGRARLADLPRLAESLAPEVDSDQLPPVTWQAQGRTVPQRVGAPQLWLDITAQAELSWTCQRCLHPVSLPTVVDRSIRFMPDEASAAELDAELDDDVLVLSRSFDLLELIEDELIMAAPLVPRHEVCPEQPLMSVSDPGVDGDDEVSGDIESADNPDLADSASADPAQAPRRAQRPNPFAVLAQLKKGGSGGDSGGGSGSQGSGEGGEAG
jgi:uncharacterized protein